MTAADDPPEVPIKHSASIGIPETIRLMFRLSLGGSLLSVARFRFTGDVQIKHIQLKLVNRP